MTSIDVTLTAEESKQFERAFQDEAFRKLMADYVTELSDPQNKEEQEAYIRQLETKKELPPGKSVVRPKPGFVVKCTHRKKRFDKAESKIKIFLNIVYSDHLSKPMSCERLSNDPHQGFPNAGTKWSVPYAIGPLRMECDKANNLVPTFDCCFHPLSLQYAHGRESFRDLIIDIAKKAATKAFEKAGDGIEIHPGYTILRGVSYKSGTPRALIVSDDSAAGDGNDAARPSRQERPANKCPKMMNCSTSLAKPAVTTDGTKRSDGDADDNKASLILLIIQQPPPSLCQEDQNI